MRVQNNKECKTNLQSLNPAETTEDLTHIVSKVIRWGRFIFFLTLVLRDHHLDPVVYLPLFFPFDSRAVKHYLEGLRHPPKFDPTAPQISIRDL
ncbi:hypothetical protein NPIL_607211 [Nephila pilipes]|uniref:Uncharacterized protein n=1 Tax=Nephila pilipes TaxID=299642 RepID=A0A8X6IVS2_NEPPI|nr:hypothetical protein NPIL_607211 [Nephila pilipes]